MCVPCTPKEPAGAVPRGSAQTTEARSQIISRANPVPSMSVPVLTITRHRDLDKGCVHNPFLSGSHKTISTLFLLVSEYFNKPRRRKKNELSLSAITHGPWPGFGPDRPELPGAMARTGPARSSSSLARPGPARASRGNGPARTAGHGPARVAP